MTVISKTWTGALMMATILAPLAAAAVSESGTASATVQQQLSLENTISLNFGQFAPGSGAGTITTGGQVTGGVSSLGGQAPATWAVGGAPDAGYSVSVSDAVLEDQAGVADNMNAALELANGTQAASDALNGSGQDSFQVFGTLSVGASQAPGTYSGSYTVTADYQ